MIYCEPTISTSTIRSRKIFLNFSPRLSLEMYCKFWEAMASKPPKGLAFFFTVENLLSDKFVLLHINFYFGETDFGTEDLILEKSVIRSWFDPDDPVLSLFPSDLMFFDEDETNGKLSRELFVLNEEGESLEEVHEENLSLHETIHGIAMAQANGTELVVELSNLINESDGKTEKIEFFAVGQGNCSAWFSQKRSTPLAVFDFGFGGIDNSRPSAAINMLKSLDSSGAIVVSHFDKDHINGFKYLSGKAWNRQWFLPMVHLSILTVVETEFLRTLWHKTTHFKNCRFLHDNELTSPLNIGRLQLSQGMVVNGKKADPWQSTYENAHSLICFIQGHRHSVLLPADALYLEFRQKYSPTYAVVAHHGCRYLIPIKNLDLSSLRKALLFCDPEGHQKYHHPHVSHLSQYSAKSVKIYRFVLSGLSPIEFGGATGSPLICKPLLNKKMSWVL